MIVSRKRMIAIIVAVLLISLGGYTLICSINEPHPLNPVVTSAALAESFANVANHGSSPSLFFHNFSLDGSSATFGFSLYTIGLTTFACGNVNGLTIYDKDCRVHIFPELRDVHAAGICNQCNN